MGKGLGVTPSFMAQAAEMLTQTVLMAPSSSHGAPLHPEISCLSSDYPYMDDQGASQLEGGPARFKVLETGTSWWAGSSPC